MVFGEEPISLLKSEGSIRFNFESDQLNQTGIRMFRRSNYKNAFEVFNTEGRLRRVIAVLEETSNLFHNPNTRHFRLSKNV